jgi:hypothetical protein
MDTVAGTIRLLLLLLDEVVAYGRGWRAARAIHSWPATTVVAADAAALPRLQSKHRSA